MGPTTVILEDISLGCDSGSGGGGYALVNPFGGGGGGGYALVNPFGGGGGGYALVNTLSGGNGGGVCMLLLLLLNVSLIGSCIFLL